MSRTIALLFTVGLLGVPIVSFAQKSDPQALAIAAKSLAVMTGGTAITDVTLTATATWTTGDDNEQGSATLMALGSGESRLDVQLSSGNSTEIRDASTGTPIGEWILNGNPTRFVPHNCWTDAAWFFPALSAMTVAPNSNVTLLNLGPTTWQGANVQHLQAYVYLSGQDQTTISFVQGVSTVDYYLDAGSLLPLAVTFNTHPDNNASTPISVQVSFSNYQAVNGALVPFHVQKYQNGNLLLDISITSAVFNSGLPLSDFNVQ